MRTLPCRTTAGIALFLLAIALFLPTAPAAADADNKISATDTAVLGAVEARLRGVSPDLVAAGLQVIGSEKVVTDKADLLSSFHLVEITPLAHGVNQQSDSTIEAVLHFADEAGRHLDMKVAAAYRPIEAGGDLGAAELVAADWEPIFARNPFTEMYVLPAIALRGADAATLGDYQNFYRFARTHAIPMHDGAPFRDRDTYAFLTFTKFAIAPDARVSIRVAKRPETTSGRPADTRYIIYDDFWRVAITGGRFDLDGIDPFWLKAIFHPGADQTDLAVTLVGLYRSYPHR